MSHKQQGYKYPTPGLSDALFSEMEARVDRAIQAAHSQMIIDAMSDPLVTRSTHFPRHITQTTLGSPFHLDEALPLDRAQRTTLWPTTAHHPAMTQAAIHGTHLRTTTSYLPTTAATAIHSPAMTTTYSPYPIPRDDTLFPLDNGLGDDYVLKGADHHSPRTSGPASSSTAKPARAIAGTARMQRATLGSAGSAPHAQYDRNSLPPAVSATRDALIARLPAFDPLNIGQPATSTADYPGADPQHRGVFVIDAEKLQKDWENGAVTKTRSDTHTVECAICRKAGLPRWFTKEAKVRRHRDLHYQAACIFCGRVMSARADIFTSHHKDGRCAVYGELDAVEGAVAAWLERHQLSGHWQMGNSSQ